MREMPTAIKIVFILCFGLFIFSLVGFPFLLTMALSNSGGSSLDRAGFFFGIIFSIIVTLHLLYSLDSSNNYVNLRIKALFLRLNDAIHNISITGKQILLMGIIFVISSILVFRLITILDDKYLKIDDKIHDLAASEVIIFQLERDDHTKIIIEGSLGELQSDQMSKSYNFTNEQLMYLKGEYIKHYDIITFKMILLIGSISLFFGGLLSLLVIKLIKIN